MIETVSPPTLEVAINTILNHLKSKSKGDLSDYGYDVCPSSAAYRWGRSVNSFRDAELAQKFGYIFYEASWELCRRGILRPGVITHGEQAIDDWGYSLTEFGKSWVNDPTKQIEVLESGSLSKVFSEFRSRFGDGFHQRSQEAIRCRNVEAWLACCTMVGAASESVLLALAIKKSNDPDFVLKKYNARDGRKTVIDMVVGKAPNHLATQLRTFLGLLSYWRDDASHGVYSELGLANADEALRQLLHLAQWTNKNWDLLTS